MTLEPSSRSFSSFSLLSFDIFGTLIDWEAGIERAYRASPLFSSLPDSHPLSSRSTLLSASEKHERRIQAAHPKALYSEVLAKVFEAVVEEFSVPADSQPGVDLQSEAVKFGQSVGHWPAFPDTVAGLQRLQKRYKLVPLSNVDNASVRAVSSNGLAGVGFAAIYTAEDIGSYKPDRRNFEYLLEHVKEGFGLEKEQVLHVAQSLFHDHVPAGEMGIERVWVDRKGLMGTVDGELKEKARFGWRVGSIGELADLMGV